MSPQVPRSLARTVAGIASFVIGVNAAMAQRSMSVGIAAGAAVPVGDLADIVRPGREVAAMVGSAPSQRFLLRAEATSRGLGGTNGAADLRVLGLSGNLVFEFHQRTAVRPYAIGGIGIYRSKFGRPESRAENDIATNAGVGLALVRGAVRMFSEIRLHNVFSGANDNNDSRRFVPITAGIMFRL